MSANGWPHELDAPLPELPSDLPPNPSPHVLATSYGTIVLVWARLMSAIVSGLHYLRGTTARAAGLAERAIEIGRDTRDEIREVRVATFAIAEKLGVALTTPVGTKPEPTLPPMRDPELSLASVTELVEGAKAAAVEGERRPDSTPDAEVDRFLDGWMARRKERDEIDRLKKAEATRVERSKARWGAVVKWGATTLAGAATAEVLRLLASIHWH